MTPKTLDQSLRKHPFLADLSDEMVSFLTGCAKNVRFSAGQDLFREGDAADTLFLVRQGHVALCSHVPGRGALQVESLGAGDVLGWSVLFEPYRWHVDCRASDDTVCFAIDGPCLRNKVNADREFGYVVMRSLLREVHRRLAAARLQQIDVFKTEFSGGSP